MPISGYQLLDGKIHKGFNEHMSGKAGVHHLLEFSLTESLLSHNQMPLHSSHLYSACPHWHLPYTFVLSNPPKVDLINHCSYSAGSSQTRLMVLYYTVEVDGYPGKLNGPRWQQKFPAENSRQETHSNEANQSEDKFKPHHHTTWGMRGSMQAQLQPHPLTQE